MEIKQNEKDKKSRNLLFLLIAVLAALNIGIGYSLWNKNKAKEVQIAQLTIDKTSLENELEKEVAKFEQLTAENEGLKGKLKEQDNALNEKISQIKLLLKKGNLTESEFRKAKNEITELRLQIENYKLKINELTQQVETLTVEKEGLNEELGSERQKTAEQLKVIESKDRTISKAKRLHAGAIFATGVRERKIFGKKEVETDKAARTEEIKVRFIIDKNDISDSGEKDIFVKIIGPDGAPIASKVQTTKVDGTETLYTEKKTIDYQNAKIEGVVYCKKQGDYPKGVYTIDIFAEGYKVGTTKMTLK
jgi:predicted RNase H-like nuclease (RuvC/YqgF family)